MRNRSNTLARDPFPEQVSTTAQDEVFYFMVTFNHIVLDNMRNQFAEETRRCETKSGQP